MKKSLVLAVALLGLVGGTRPAHAIQLSSLLTPGATLTVGNLVFSNFVYHQNGGSTTPPADIQVSPESVGGETGFVITGGFKDTTFTGTDQTLDYTVTAKTGLITDAVLTVSAALTGATGLATGPAAAIVTENYVGTSIPTLSAGLVKVPGSPVLGNNSDFVTFAGQKSLSVHKDLFLLSSLNGPIFASFSTVDQLFSTNVSTPEPSSLALGFVGVLGGLGLAIRRRVKGASL